MNITSPNYQFSFKALVPKAQYSGIPRLSSQVIQEIKRLQECVKVTDREITDLENNICNPDNQGRIISYLKRRLEIVRDFKKKLEDEIAIMKQYNFHDYKENYKMQKDYSKELEKLDDAFANASFMHTI